MFEASKKYPRRILPVIHPWLKIVNILYNPDKFMIRNLGNLGENYTKLTGSQRPWVWCYTYL
jgi:hypothetical protein